MPVDPGLLDLMRDDLEDLHDITEKKMFGGVCMMWQGHMLCGVHKNGAMYRVGKVFEAAARALPGTRAMDFTGRPMGGMIEVAPEDMGDDGLRAQLIEYALMHLRTLPPKV